MLETEQTSCFVMIFMSVGHSLSFSSPRRITNSGLYCNCCRVKYYFLLRISLCFVLVTLRYQMSDLVRCRFAINSLNKRAYCEGFCVHLATHSGVTERTIGKRLYHCINFLVVFVSCRRMLYCQFSLRSCIIICIRVMQ